jgi:hypothetical protein
VKRVVPHDLAVQLARIGVEEELVGVEAVAVLGVVGPVDAVAVDLAGPIPGR